MRERKRGRERALNERDVIRDKGSTSMNRVNEIPLNINTFGVPH